MLIYVASKERDDGDMKGSQGSPTLMRRGHPEEGLFGKS